MSHRFSIISMHPGTLLGEEDLEKITGKYFHALGALGGQRSAPEATPEDDVPVFLLVTTGGSEQVILDWWTDRRRTPAAESLFLIAHPGNNSLPAALEVLARLQQDGASGRIFYLNGPDDASGFQKISDAVHDMEVRSALQQARIGVVGTPSDWLVASSPDASTVRAAWGPTVVPVEMGEVVKTLETISDTDIALEVEDFVSNATEVREPVPADLREATRIYIALKRVVDDHQLDALTVRCFDFVQNQRTTGCFGLAQLTDEGIIAGCEGDIVSTVGLMWANKLLGVTPWMANPSGLDSENNTLWLAHCTVPRTLVESYGLRSHFESGRGVGIQGTLPTGPVTLVRIGGREMEKVWFAEGEIRRTGDAENLCRTQVEVRLTRGGTTTDLLSAPLGNHLVLVYGHHLERLQSWCGGMLSSGSRIRQP